MQLSYLINTFDATIGGSFLSSVGDVANYAEGEDAGIKLFLPEPSEIFWSALSIALIAFAFYKFFLPTVNKLLSDRAEKIEGEIANAAQIKKDAESLHEKYSSEIDRAKTDANEIRDNARTQAGQIVEDAKAKATADAELIINNARRAVEQDRKAAETSLKREIGSLAMAMTQKMLNQGVENYDRQSKLLDRSLSKLDSSLNGKETTSASKFARGGNSSRNSSSLSNGEKATKSSQERVRRRINLSELEKPKRDN